MTGRLAIVTGILVYGAPLFAQLDENCTVSMLNRNARVNADGVWLLTTVPANFGKSRARVTCSSWGY